MSRDTYTSAQVAEKIGMTVRTFYHQRPALHRAGMPDPISPIGQPKWDKLSFDAWRHRHHPLAPQRPANDSAPIAPEPETIEEHRMALHRAYAKAG